MVFQRFLPKNEEFFGDFDAASANAVEIAEALVEILDGTGEVGRKIHLLGQLEHRGDEITHRIFNALNSTFVTPLDREDIQGLASRIDDFVDDVEETGQRISLYELTDVPEQARLLGHILVEQARAFAGAMPLLENIGKHHAELRHAILEVHRLENEGDDALNSALGNLFDSATDTRTLVRCIQWREVYGLLEDATDRAEDVANLIEGIMLKHG